MQVDARDMSSVPESGRSPGVGKGTPLQYSCLENPMDRGAWQATVSGAAESQTWQQLSSSKMHVVPGPRQETLPEARSFATVA